VLKSWAEGSKELDYWIFKTLDAVESRVLLPSGTPPDLPGAYAAFQRACQLKKPGGLEGCVVAGVMLEKGEGVPRNAAKATEMYEQACASGMEPISEKKIEAFPLEPLKPVFVAIAEGYSLVTARIRGCQFAAMNHRDGVGVPSSAEEGAAFDARAEVLIGRYTWLLRRAMRTFGR
jgi:hypothetical protein